MGPWPVLCAQAGQKFRAGPEVPGRFRPGSGLSRELARSGLVWTPGAEGSGQAGRSGGGSSGLRPEVPGFPEARPCFFSLLLFHAWPWSLDSPWSSRSYLSICKIHA